MPSSPVAPRMRRKPPAYRRHSTGQAFVEIRGRRYYLGAWSKDRSAPSWDAYERKLADFWARPAEPPPELQLTANQVDRLDIYGLLLRYRRHAEKEYSKEGKPTRFFANLAPAIRRLRELYGKTSARDFGPLKFMALRETWIKEGKARKTVNEYTNIVRRVFKYGVKFQLVPPTVLEGLKAVEGLRRGRSGARETAPVQPVADDVIDATLPHLPPIVADMVRLQRLTGCRPGEVCIMRRRDVRRDSQKRDGHRAKSLPLIEADVWEYWPQHHKTEHLGHELVKYIGPRAQMILRPYLVGEADGYCFSPAESERKRRERLHDERQTPLTYGNSPGTNRKETPKRGPGQHYTATSYRKAIHRACDLAFPPPAELTDEAAILAWKKTHRWSPNQIRHTRATEIRSSHGLEAASVSLGHKHMNTTEIYALADREKAKAIAREVG